MEVLLGGMLGVVETIRMVNLPRFWQELLDKIGHFQLDPELVRKRQDSVYHGTAYKPFSEG